MPPETPAPFPWLKAIRRLHLFTGLLLCPFVLIIGLSGFLFNHGDEGPDPQRLDPSRVLSASGFAKLPADQAAASIVAGLRRQGHSFSLADPGQASYSGPAVFSGAAGRLSLELDSGAASFIPKAPATSDAAPPFAAMELALPGFDPQTLQEKLPLAAGLPSGGFKAAPRGGPELRFDLVDADGKRWLASYDLNRRSLKASAADAPGSLSLSSILTRLHKTHHYPDSLSAKWCWVFLADATALAMILWALSGLVLAWQIRPLRRLGLACLGLALCAAVLVIAGNFRDLEAAAAKSQEPASPSPKQGN